MTTTRSGGKSKDGDETGVHRLIMSRGGDEDNASSEAPDDLERSATDPGNADPNVEAMDGATIVSIDGTDDQGNRDLQAEDSEDDDDDNNGDKNNESGYEAGFESSYDVDEDDDDSFADGIPVPNEETKEETAKSPPASSDGSATETGLVSKDKGDESNASGMASKDEENIDNAAGDVSGDGSAVEAKEDNNNAPGEETKHEEDGDIASKDTSLGTTAAGGIIQETLGPGGGSTVRVEDSGLLEIAPAPSPAPEPASGVVPTMIVADHGDVDDNTPVLAEPTAVLGDEAKEEEDRGDTNEN